MKAVYIMHAKCRSEGGYQRGTTVLSFPKGDGDGALLNTLQACLCKVKGSGYSTG